MRREEEDAEEEWDDDGDGNEESNMVDCGPKQVAPPVLNFAMISDQASQAEKKAKELKQAHLAGA